MCDLPTYLGTSFEEGLHCDIKENVVTLKLLSIGVRGHQING